MRGREGAGRKGLGEETEQEWGGEEEGAGRLVPKNRGEKVLTEGEERRGKEVETLRRELGAERSSGRQGREAFQRILKQVAKPLR